MAIPPHESSYYEATAHRPEGRHALAGEVSCDVCVVGAGIAGCSTALHLAERGYRVVLLEAERVGAGASGRNGGQVLAGVAADQADLERIAGAAAARAVWEISVEGVRLVRDLVARHGIACDWVCGHMQVAITRRQDVALQALLRRMRDGYGYGSLEYMPRDSVRATLATDRYIAAIHDSSAGHLHPLAYTLGLAAAAERRGVRIFERTRALGFRSGAGVCVETPAGRVRSRFLALCGNASLGSTAPALRSKIMAVGSSVVATAPLGARADGLIANDAAVSDSSWVLDYFRLTADRRLLFGGGVTYSGLDPARIAAWTRRRLVRVFPQLSGVPIEHAWGGYLALTRNRIPNFGRLGPEVYFVQGFSGHGIALAGMAGMLIAEAVAGIAERFDLFAGLEHRDFPGGPLLGRPALVLAMLYYRLRDSLGG